MENLFLAVGFSGTCLNASDLVIRPGFLYNFINPALWPLENHFSSLDPSILISKMKDHYTLEGFFQF